MALLTSVYVRVQVPRRETWIPTYLQGYVNRDPFWRNPMYEAGAALNRTEWHGTVRAGVRAVKPDISKYRDFCGLVACPPEGV